MAKRNLKHWDSLLSDINTGLEAMPDARVSCLEVIFHCPNGTHFPFDLVHALDAIANDLYWGHSGDWSEATRASIHTI